MKARKMYRIELISSDWSVPVDVAVLACLSNGGQYMNLYGIEMYAKAKFIASGIKGFTVNLIGNHSLTIDKGTENLLSLTEVEVMELVDEESPTLHRYSMDNPPVKEPSY